MNKYSVIIAGTTWERITKKAARKAYISGCSIAFCPVNLRPGEPWHPETIMNRKSREEFTTDETGVKNDFNNYVNSFEFYNCINSETGKYTAFYMEV